MEVEIPLVRRFVNSDNHQNRPNLGNLQFRQFLITLAPCSSRNIKHAKGIFKEQNSDCWKSKWNDWPISRWNDWPISLLNQRKYKSHEYTQEEIEKCLKKTQTTDFWNIRWISTEYSLLKEIIRHKWSRSLHFLERFDGYLTLLTHRKKELFSMEDALTSYKLVNKGANIVAKKCLPNLRPCATISLFKKEELFEQFRDNLIRGNICRKNPHEILCHQEFHQMMSISYGT